MEATVTIHPTTTIIIPQITTTPTTPLTTTTPGAHATAAATTTTQITMEDADAHLSLGLTIMELSMVTAKGNNPEIYNIFKL